MATVNAPHGEQRGMGRTLRDDFARGDFKRTMRRDFHELKELFIDDHRRERLGGMGRVRRWFYTIGWLLKSLFFRLTPARRVLFVICLILLASSYSVGVNDEKTSVTIKTDVAAGIILIFVLMLELKDKLLAQDELEAGRVIQSALQPERRPSVPGWSCWLFTKAANEVGGDLVDVQNIGADRYLFSLADVAGKGVRAALVTTRLQATIRALAPESATLGALASKINALIHRDTTRNMFASLLLFQVTPRSGEMRIINAGHLPPLTFKAKGVEELGKGDPAVGIFPETAYAEQHVSLERGEIFIVYSDGIPDAKNETGDFFGLTRLKEILDLCGHLPPEDLGARITQSVENYIGGARVYDDISLIIVRRE